MHVKIKIKKETYKSKRKNWEIDETTIERTKRVVEKPFVTK